MHANDFMREQYEKTFKFMRRTKVVDRGKCELIFNRFIGILFPLKFIIDLKVS